MISELVLELEQHTYGQIRQRKCSGYFKHHHFPLPQPPQPEQLMGQCPHLPPQIGDFPFFLSFIIFMIISATITARTMQTMIVPMFAPIYDSIQITPLQITVLLLLCVQCKLFVLDGQLCCFLVRSEQHKDHTDEQQ